MEYLPDTKKWKVLVENDVNQAASEFVNLPPDKAISLAQNLGVDYMTNVILQLESNSAVEMLNNLNEDFKNKIIDALPAEKASNIKEILSYAPHTAAALMSKDFFAISADSTISEATKYLQAISQQKKGKISYIYVVDENQRLEGVIQIRDLILHPSDTPVRAILNRNVIRAEAQMSQLEVAKLLQTYHYLGIPIVDKNQRLIGVVNADSVLKVYEEQAHDDIAKLVGTGPEEIKTRSIRKIISLRLPWLSVNIASGIFCAYISGVFQNRIQTIVSLFLFVPIVLGLSESTGIQGATIVVRNIALGNKTLKNLSMLLMREVTVGVLIGFICGALVGTIASLWQGGHLLGIAITTSITTAIIISALLGLLMPILFMTLGIDPALASGPLVLAICDIETLAVYFTISRLILQS